MNNKHILFLLLVSTILIVASYYYVDRQVVWFLVALKSRDWIVLKLLANSITTLIGVCIFLFYIYIAIQLMLKNALNPILKKLVVMSHAVVLGVFLKDTLKVMFGRYWTSTFQCNNSSLIRDNVYGFNWFNNGSAYTSFPSGHTTFIFAFSVSMWFLFPRLRWLWSFLAACVLIGQIGMYYHFVSDVIAGIALGSLVAIFNYRYYLLSK